MQTITPSALKDLLLQKAVRPQPVWLIAIVDAQARKTGNELPGRLLKISRYKAFIGNYENSVNRQLGREGLNQLTFTAKPRPWGTRLNMGLVHHVVEGQDRYYLSAQILETPNPLYLVEQQIQHGRWPRRKLVGIAKELIAELLPTKQAEGLNQGVKRAVVYRDVQLDHITFISFGGERYKVVAS